MNDLEIKEYDGRRGIAFECTFNLNGNWYWADLAFTPDHGNECMIFHSNKKGEVKNWSEVYSKLGLDISEDCLRSCIEEFCDEQSEVEHE